MQIIHLKKSGGSRFHNVSTFRIVCDHPSSNLLLTSSLKSSHEVGYKDDEFTHVAKGRFQSFAKDCVVKVHHSMNPLYHRELSILQHLSSYRNIVQYVCHFSCMDTKERWMQDIVAHRPLIPCQSAKKDELAFIVMEYIPHGNILDFFQSTPTSKVLKSLFLQTALLIIELGMKFKIYHGDLNSGNVLLKRTKPNATMTYEVEDRVIKVKTLGIRPVLIDFGRGGFYDKKSKNRSLIMDDIMITLSMYSNWIQDDILVQRVRDVVRKHSQWNKKPSFIELLEDIEQL